jgi:two-component system, NtrC family, response regulator HydG
MKRILVIDDSEVVRETLALILGHEFVVSKRTLGTQGLTFADTQNECDLLILGISPRYGVEAASLMRFASQLPFAVLFLVDSKSTARAIQPEFQVACLTKPFNPYDLHEKVGQLLQRRAAFAKPVKSPRELKDVASYLQFPYLSRSAATLIDRLASARLPLLISGEIGCGQDRVALGIHRLHASSAMHVTIDAAEASAEALSKTAHQLSMNEGLKPGLTTLILQNLDRASSAAQSVLLSFLHDAEERFDTIRYLATANGDLLERVYRGEFLEALYYRLATLTLKLLPLRERRDDIPILASWFARRYAEALGLGEPALSPEANRRLSNYLWFGNLSELESVIARTLALRRKGSIDALDLAFDFGDAATDDARALTDLAADPYGDRQPAQPQLRPYVGATGVNGSVNDGVKSVDLNMVIHELAHEFKNPMVTIKTFAQLLTDRYQDENFRSRFQEVVGGDIERMDELLEMMIEFADFSQPHKSDVALDEKLRTALTEIHGECAKRQARIEWKENGAAHIVRADESHLAYILKNLLLAALSETKMGSEIQIEISRNGALAVSYPREGARVASIAHYLDKAAARTIECALPLRVLLAKHLLERNGGRFAIDPSESDRETLRMEFPIVEHG